MPSPIHIESTEHTLSNVSLSLVESDRENKNEEMASDRLCSSRILVSVDQHERTLPIGYYRGVRRVPLTREKSPLNPEGWPSPVNFQSLGPRLLEDERIAEIWDSLALTQSEEFIVDVLNLATRPTIERIAVMGDCARYIDPFRRRVRSRRIHCCKTKIRVTSCAHRTAWRRC